MPYKISGSTSEETKLIIIEETGWTITASGIENGSYEIDLGSEDGPILIVGRRTSDGYSLGYGNITPAYEGPAVGQTGIFGGGGGYGNNIEYITISTTGDAEDFGDLTLARTAVAGVSNSTSGRAVFAGGSVSPGGIGNQTNVIDYVTMLTPANANNYGDLAVERANIFCMDNATGNRGLWVGGTHPPIYSNVREYITISSTGNATDWGDLPTPKGASAGGTSNATGNRGIMFGGSIGDPNYINSISYVTINTGGNTADFGDLSEGKGFVASVSNGTSNRAVCAGGYDNPHDGEPSTHTHNTMEYITITSTGNASDFGDLWATRSNLGAVDNKTNNRGVVGDGSDLYYITITSLGNTTSFGSTAAGVGGTGGTSNA